MKNTTRSVLLLLSAATSPTSIAADDANKDPRQLVQFPEMMQQHMMANMRDHLAAINEIIINLGNDELDKAADIAEYRLGMSALESHGAKHRARFMPEGMRQAGTEMHHAASRFARTAQEGDLTAAIAALPAITQACVACHSGYRIQ